MKTSVKRILALASASALLLSSCGGTGAGTGGNSGEPINDLVTYELSANEITDFNWMHSQYAADLQVLTSLQDSLLTNDTEGGLAPCLAETWETTDGGHTWTFHLRDDAKWVDVNGEEKAALTSADFITGLEWVLNVAKNEGYNASMPIALIEGAQEYYQYTSELDAEEAKALASDNETFLEMVGIEAPDEYTVTYTCIDEKPYFDSVAVYNCLYPVPAALVEEVGVDGFLAIQPDTMWYSGPYLLTTFVQNNEKIFTPNPLWWGADDNTRFDSVTIKMVESTDNAFQLYQSGEIDNVTLTESSLSTIYNDEENEFHDYLVEARPLKYSYQFLFNYDKNLEDGVTEDVNWNTAVRNVNFRLAWYYGLDLTNYYKRLNAINPLKCENDLFTMTNLVFTSDGTDYSELVRQELGLDTYNGESMVRLDAEKAEGYKQKAIEELTAQGVTFPVEVDYYVPSNDQTSQDNAKVLKDCMSDSLGDDFVVLNIKEYVNNQTTEVITPRKHSFALGGWGADYADPQNFLGQALYGREDAFFSTNRNFVNDVTEEEAPEFVADMKEFTALVDAADAITDDLDARYAAYAKAEAYLIEHAFTLPVYYGIQWQLTKINDYSKVYVVYGTQNYRYLNWETNPEGYTTADYEELASK